MDIKAWDEIHGEKSRENLRDFLRSDTDSYLMGRCNRLPLMRVGMVLNRHLPAGKQVQMFRLRPMHLVRIWNEYG